MGRSSSAEARYSFSSKESIEDTRLGANGSRSASAVSACRGIRLDDTLLPLTCLATDQELFLSSSKKILKAALFPEHETLGDLSCGAKP